MTIFDLYISGRIRFKPDEGEVEKVQSLVGPQERLLSTTKSTNLISTVTHLATILWQKTNMGGTVKGGRWRGRQHKSWADNIKEWTRMPTPELRRLTSVATDS